MYNTLHVFDSDHADAIDKLYAERPNPETTRQELEDALWSYLEMTVDAILRDPAHYAWSSKGLDMPASWASAEETAQWIKART